MDYLQQKNDKINRCRGCGHCDSINGTKKVPDAAPLDNVPDAEVLKEELNKQTIQEIIRQIIAETGQ